MNDQRGFILTRQWRDTRNGTELEFWLSSNHGPVKLLVPQQESVFFIAVEQVPAALEIVKSFAGFTVKDVPLKNFTLQPVKAFYFKSQRTLREAKTRLLEQGLSPLESDINPHDRFLMERFIRGSLKFRGEAAAGKFPVVHQAEMTSDNYQPLLKVISLDIETAMQGINLYSIGIYAVAAGSVCEKVFMVADKPVADNVEIFNNEKSLIIGFLIWLADYDPDIIIGWNVINFDMWYLEKVCEKYQLPFRCGRGETGKEAAAHWRTLDDEGERRAVSIPGRVVLDGIELLKAAFYRFESFALNNVAKELLGNSKLIQDNDRGEKITDLFLENKLALAKYNVQDCKLVWDIFEHTKLLDFAIARTKMTGLPLERIGGSVASFDFRYLPLLHRKGFVAPNSHLLEDAEQSPGGFVMESQPGIYDYVAMLDFKSLYPSIIRSFKIDPLGMVLGEHKGLDQSELVPGFNGAWFSKTNNILPELIAELWQLRDQAKANSDAALSQAIKIIMNSFYGVLGSGGCRFFDSRLASSITKRGHQIIQQTADFIEQQGWQVIYGDTDSVFIWFKDVEDADSAAKVGKELEEKLNLWWDQRLQKEYGIESALEIEFETLYQRFLMPTIRGSDQGSKKRYAGVVLNKGKKELVFKGLENVRTDWTKIARDFQSELYRRVFLDEPYHDYIKSVVQSVLDGDIDNELVYRKRLRRRLDEYRRNVPPHVQAARKAVEQAGAKIRRGDWIEYVITINGAEPVVAQDSLIDYQHYIDKQLAPAADGILYFKNESLAGITDQQIGLFE